MIRNKSPMLELNCSAISLGPIDMRKRRLHHSNSTHNQNSSFLSVNSTNTKSFLSKKYEAKIDELLSVISNLTEEKAILFQENQKFKDENNELQKINKELLSKVVNQKKHLESLHIELSRNPHSSKEHLPSLVSNKISKSILSKRPVSTLRAPRSCNRLGKVSFEDIQIQGLKNNKLP
jgi:phenylalanyl-tRNA synthetase alpha subunit